MSDRQELQTEAASAGMVPEQASILVVDDTPANLTAMRSLLEPLNRPIVEAQSGDEALRQLLFRRFAVILMDVQMPGMDGLETARLIKARERTRHIPIIFVTALHREADLVTRGYSEGAVDYLMKPIDPNILCAKVKVFYDLFEQGEQLRAQAYELAERRVAEESARRDSELQRELLAIVGHDLRNPLSTVLTSADLLLARGSLNSQDRSVIERVQRAGDRMRSLVEQMVDFTRARLSHGMDIERTECDLAEVAQRIVEEFRANHPQRSFQLTAEGSTAGEFDTHRIERLLVNLLENAVRYGSADAPVEIRVWTDGDRGCLSVRNQGPTIPENVQSVLFEPYKRATAQASKAGLGLGLYIVREIARAHGGDVSVRSRDGEGTTFTATFPLLSDQPCDQYNADTDAGASV